MMTLADLAVELSEELGPVFPCDASKRPLVRHGFKDASCDADRIYELFANAPNAALIGIAMGEIIAVDIDRKNGRTASAGQHWQNYRSPEPS